MSNSVTGPTDSNNIPPQNVAPPPADAETSSADSAHQTNATESSPALVVTTESSNMADAVFSSTSVGYQQYMSLEPASLPEMFDALIAQQRLRNKTQEEMSKTSMEMMDGMSNVVDNLMEASQNIQQNHIDDVTEQANTKKKKKIFGWFSKIATAIIGVALIATGVGTALGATMLAMSVLSAVTAKAGGLDAALEKLFPDSKVAQAICKFVVVAAVIAVGVLSGGASLLGTLSLAASVSLSMYSDQLTTLMTEKWGMSNWGAMLTLFAAQLASGAAVCTTAQTAKRSMAVAKAGYCAMTLGGVMAGASQIAQGKLNIDLADLGKKIAEERDAMMQLKNNVDLIIDKIDKKMAEYTEIGTEYSRNGMEFLTQAMDTSFEASRKTMA